MSKLSKIELFIILLTISAIIGAFVNDHKEREMMVKNYVLVPFKPTIPQFMHGKTCKINLKKNHKLLTY